MKLIITKDIGYINSGIDIDSLIKDLQELKEEYPDQKVYVSTVEYECHCGTTIDMDELRIVCSREETNEEYSQRIKKQKQIEKEAKIRNNKLLLSQFAKLPQELQDKIKNGVDPKEIIKKLDNEIQ